jgi:hypothetical protein
MGVFGGHSRNKVYYRRKSIRLHSYALGLASCAALGFSLYFISRRAEMAQDGVDEVTTSTLAWHEPLKYYHYKFFGGGSGRLEGTGSSHEVAS